MILLMSYFFVTNVQGVLVFVPLFFALFFWSSNFNGQNPLVGNFRKGWGKKDDGFIQDIN